MADDANPNGSNGKDKSRDKVRRVPGGNGKGMILQGGPGPPAPGPGRPHSRIKAALAGAFEDRIPRLQAIADGEVELCIRQKCPKCGHEPEPVPMPVRTATTDVLKAMDLMGKYGLGQGVDPETVRQRLARTINVIRTRFPGAAGEACLDELAEIW
jgi:hypothetical protein